MGSAIKQYIFTHHKQLFGIIQIQLNKKIKEKNQKLYYKFDVG